MPKKDINQLAKSILDQAIGEAPKVDSARRVNSSKGGLKGGKARMAKLTADQRRELSLKAVAARKKAPAGEAGAPLVKK
ncbi:MAG: histone H1 [Betaproteobacteria bacterium]|nr:MAG: histone H1 [Betaproteobacteria bacterium]